MPFSTVLERRRSVRAIARAPFHVIAGWLSTSLRAREIETDLSARRMRRPALSAGALHPIEAVLVRGDEFPIAMHYDPLDDAVVRMAGLDRDAVRAALDACHVVLPDAKGDFLFLLAAATRTAAYYDAPESLFWRDAGAVTQTLAMTAEAQNLAFCPLGIFGAEIVEAIDVDAGTVLAVGVCAIGRAT